MIIGAFVRWRFRASLWSLVFWSLIILQIREAYPSQPTQLSTLGPKEVSRAAINPSNGTIVLSQNSKGPLSEKDQAELLFLFRQFMGGMINKIPGDNPARPFFNIVLTGLIDPRIARYLSAEDQRLLSLTIQQGLQANQNLSWSNPNTGRGGQFRTLRNYTDASGRTCKEYETPTTLEDGQTITATRRACLDADGFYAPVG